MVRVYRLGISRYLLWLAIFVAPGAQAAISTANSPSNPAVDESLRQQQRQIQLEQQRLEREQLQRDRLRDTPPLKLASPADATGDETGAKASSRPNDKNDKEGTAAPCQLVKRIEIVGATLVKKRHQDALFKGYLDRCLSASDINALLQSVTSWYELCTCFHRYQ